MPPIAIKIANDFATSPGPRKIVEGKFSGELFRKELLLPRLRLACEQKCKLVVDLDGTSGFGTSFLEESFGGLIRDDNVELGTIRQVVEFVSNDEPDLLDEINEYLEDAAKEKKQAA